MNEKTKRFCIELGYIFAVPLVVMTIISIVFFEHGLYPFGKGTVAWCDMTQQVIPMTSDLKDILSGKAGLFLNLNNAGGMNMIGVIFFFVASPFNLLALTVDKIDLVYFMNILTMLKMMACSLTAMIFLRRQFKRTSPVISACLSVSYAFCGYAVVYYQNSIWLDIMYLFPLLMLGIGQVVEKGRIAPYVAVLSLMAAVNYYICYMIALFCILFFALICIRDKKREHLATGFLFIVGSLLSLLLTAVIWLPSLLQFFSSARTTSITENIRNEDFLTEFQTTLPLILYSAVGIVIIAACAFDKKAMGRKNSTLMIMLGLMFIPMLAEPINLMWHTGSYMSFPCRFAFMTVFIMLTICAGLFEEGSGHIAPYRKGISRFKRGAAVFSGVGLTIFCAYAVRKIMAINAETIDTYSRRLWADDTSLAIEAKVFFAVTVCFGVVFLLHKRGLLGRRLFAGLMCCFVAVEAFASVGMYMTGSLKYSYEKAAAVRDVYRMEGKIEDDDFYRVKTTAKQFDVNDIGAMGYRTMSHYTSLTDKGYMYTMKRLGYSSYWMEVGSHGGTELTDALLSIRYKIGLPGVGDDCVYADDNYGIYRRKNTIGLGLVTDRDISGMKDLEGLDRMEVQQGLYSTLFSEGEGDELMTRYEAEPNGEVIVTQYDDAVEISPMKKDGEIIYKIFVRGRQYIYFDCFDKATSNLYEKIYDSFSVSVDGLEVQTNYPSQSSNGLLCLGEYENTTVTVVIKVHKSLMCTSFGVYGMDSGKLEKAVAEARSAELNEESGVISGSVSAGAGDRCVLFIPYSGTLKVEINGEEVGYEKAFGDFVAFDLKEGENSIRVTNHPMGVTAGWIITAVGALLCGGVYILRKKVKLDDTVYSVMRAAVIIFGTLVFAVVYIYPVIINFFGVKAV